MTKEMFFLLFIAGACILTALLLGIQWIMDNDKEDKE